MLEHGTFLVPTLSVPIGVLEAGMKGGMQEYGTRKAKEAVEIYKESIAKAHNERVKIAMGTDSTVTPHGENLREPSFMVEIGMSPMEAILSSIKVTVECLGWEDRLGTLEAGKLADLIITQENPLDDIRSSEKVENISLVMLDGKIVEDAR